MKITDLTYVIEEGMTTYPRHWHPMVEISQLGRHGIENRETRKLVIGTHTGTHLDAPLHFIPGGSTVEDIPLDLMVGNARLVDFSDLPERTRIEPELFQERAGSDLPERLLFRFDWHKHWGKMKYYEDHPFLSVQTARFLVNQGVRMVAMDTPQPDNPRSSEEERVDSPIHKILLGNGIIIVEYLTNLNQLKQRELELLILPLKVKDGDGAPVRALAVERDE